MLTIEDVQKAPGRIVPVEPGADVSRIRLERAWDGNICKPRLVNEGREPVRIGEVVLFSIPHSLPPETGFYGEGFTMLSQTAGTLAQPVDIGSFTDRGHYRIPQPEDAITAYGMITLSPPACGGVSGFGLSAEQGPSQTHQQSENRNAIGNPKSPNTGQQQHLLLAFASCNRFVGKFHVRENVIDCVLDAEGLEIAPGETWALEWFTSDADENRNAALARLGEAIQINHPLSHMPERPLTGWCSWYCFGAKATAKDILDNLDYIAKNVPGLKYIQIDDGYQAAVGDWLETGDAFGGRVQDVLAEIRKRGFEPGIWVAPFVAEENSRLFREHPDYFIKDADGNPLRSDRVTFGGWRRGPWYALDGTHPGAQAYIHDVFETMHNDWGCNYFKLDACFWGAMHGGRFHDPGATRVQAYRAGMEMALKGAGWTYLLGCNHPMWPSLGLAQCARLSGDISRTWKHFSDTARENLLRNWQNGRLWWADPDCVVLTGDLPDNEFMFHAAAVYATGGMLLSGDDLPTISPERLEMLKKMIPPTGVPAEFEDMSLGVGWVSLPDRKMLCLLNWEDEPRKLSARLPGRCTLTDYWSGERLGTFEGAYEADMQARSGMVLSCEM